MFKNIPIVTRLIFLVSVITLLMLGTIIYATTDGLRAMQRLDDDMQMTIDNVQAFDRINFLMARNRYTLLDGAMSSDPAYAAKKAEEFLSYRSVITEASKKYEATVQDDKQRELLDSWKKHRAAYAKDGNDPLVAALQAGRMAEAAKQSTGIAAQLYEPIDKDIENIRSLQPRTPGQEGGGSEGRQLAHAILLHRTRDRACRADRLAGMDDHPHHFGFSQHIAGNHFQNCCRAIPKLAQTWSPRMNWACWRTSSTR